MIFRVLLSRTILAKACGGMTGYLSSSSYIARCWLRPLLCPPPLFLAIPRPLTLRSRSDSVKTFLHCERPYGPSHRVFSQAETSDCNCSRLDSFENEISASSIIVSRPQPVSLSSLFSRSDRFPSSERARDWTLSNLNCLEAVIATTMKESPQ